ncbi:DEAD/DEAH box helicase family protein [Desulforhopalus vacuolatus]|uniref:DEAD/DEAH box helicase n=1 Tax=Desulforhopalus vacuolatus TaxID=40414 RepID=UPI001964488F|nr:helicase-related protein [Desulforhopalus vacuolatus]MBM9518328.1 DEAD/DEAH box helicase family protein [Desulforhopalus vacuolatus]
MDNWQYSTLHKSACKVVDEQTLWGQTVCRVWLPNQDAVVRVPQSDLTSLSTHHSSLTTHYIAYISAAAKVAEVLEGSSGASDGHVLLAPMESNVTPLPHQIHALSRAISGDRVRYLLADEVGLGKTIEAGLVMRELKLRGLVRRTLVVTPKSLAMQWVAEMDTHFNESFSLVNPGDLDALERLERPGQYVSGEIDHTSDYNPWMRFPQAIVTLDAVKPLTRRRGWSKEKIQAYNRNRYEKLLQGQWDLIVVDESHRMGGSTDQVARYKLGQGLAEAAPYLLLLSATPHQGKSDAFQRLMSLLDPMSFPDLESVTRDRVSEFVIRTEKRKAVTADGKPLFRPRTTQTLSVDLERNPAQVALYEAVTDYAKEGYNRAVKDHKPHIGFLMVLLQRIVTSSSHAIRCTLERRLQALENLRETRISLSDEELEDFTDIDGQMQLDLLVEVDEQGRTSEMAEVNALLDLARVAEMAGPDVKTETLMNLIFQLQGEENDDQLKLLIFTEFVPTQAMLRTFLEERGIPCAILNGSMSMDERRMAQRDFRDSARVLIATDAGGEGLNLQFCHVVVNYDLPWNPMRIEQRIGRVDRIGQSKIVRAVNFVYENSVEGRVREVLRAKLSIILDEMGIDKEGDILDTSLSGEMIEKMMTHVIMEDANLDAEADQTVQNLQEEMQQVREQCAVYGISEEPDLPSAEKLRSHPLPYWIEQMTIHYLHTKECKLEKDLLGWNFTWPDGENVQSAVFQSRALSSDGNLLSLENARIRGLAMNLPQFIPGQSLPCVSINGLPETVTGLWGLYEIRMSVQQPANSQIRIPLIRRSYLPVFMSNEGKLFMPTARHIWDQLLTNDLRIDSLKDSNESIAAGEKLFSAAEQAGQELFDTMQAAHFAAVAREEERGMIAFASRRKGIDRLGLPEVRQFRLARLDEDESQWRSELKSARQIVPEMRPLLMLKIGNGGVCE